MEGTPARISVIFPVENPPVDRNYDNALRGEDQPPTIDHTDIVECFPWMSGRSKINRMEVRAALSMSINVLPFWLCTFPVSCQSIAL